MELTTRQWQLYNLLKSNPDKWFSQKEICDAVDGYEYVERDNDRCPAIRIDKNEINANDRVDKIIVMKNYCFKIGTLEEYTEERAAHIRRLKNQVKFIKDMDAKFERNGQVKLFNNILEELKPENEQYHETFIKKNEFELPKEINGVKVYTRVLIDEIQKTAYIVTVKKMIIDCEISSCNYKASCIMADDRIETIAGINENTMSFETFMNDNYYNKFRKEFIR